MQIKYLFIKQAMVILVVSLALAGCYRQPVRHLSSDVSLLQPGSTTKQEVLTYLGPPDQRRPDSREGEIWIYHQSKKSFLRKTPLVGRKVGRQQYDVAIITFRGEVVHASTYRSFDEQEFEEAGIGQGESSGL
jgi:hypothetical protein